MPTRDGFDQDHSLPLHEPEEQGVEKAWGRAVISSPTKDCFNLLLLFLSDGPEQQGIGKAWDSISSPTKENQDNPLPLFLADEPEQQSIGKAWDRAVISSRVLKASILVATATAIGVTILSVGNPVTLFADVTASLVDKSALQPGTDQPTSTIQSTADVQALPPTAKDALTRDQIAAISEPAGQTQPGSDQSTPTMQSTFDAQALPPTAKDALTRDQITAVSELAGQNQPGADQSASTIQSTVDAQALPPAAKDALTRDQITAASEPIGLGQTEDNESSSEALFRQFKAWAAEKDAQAKVGPVRPVQDAPAQVAENARAPLRSMQKHRHVLSVHHARAEIQHVQNPPKKVRREQTARVQVSPASSTTPPKIANPSR
jgi:hypothetical protein